MDAVDFFHQVGKIAETGMTGRNNHKKVFTNNSKTVGRFLRINFTGKNGTPVSIIEVEVFEKTVN